MRRKATTCAFPNFCRRNPGDLSTGPSLLLGLLRGAGPGGTCPALGEGCLALSSSYRELRQLRLNMHLAGPQRSIMHFTCERKGGTLKNFFAMWSQTRAEVTTECWKSWAPSPTALWRGAWGQTRPTSCQHLKPHHLGKDGLRFTLRLGA